MADFNRDGLPDLATASEFKGKINILLGNATSIFKAPLLVDVSDPPSSRVKVIKSGDLNGDMIPDLILGFASSTDCTPDCDTVPGGVSILLGHGDGTFTEPSRYDSVISPEVLSVGDFGGDGRTDVAVIDFQDPFTQGGRLLTLQGGGDGTLAAPAGQLPGVALTALAVGDIDGDSTDDLAALEPDLVTCNMLDCETEPGGIWILRGGRTGIALTQHLEALPGPAALAIVESNGTRTAALAVVADDVLSVHSARPDGTFGPARDYAVGGDPASVNCGDANNDDIPDLIVANGHTNDVSVLIGDGRGRYFPEVRSGVARSPLWAEVADLGRDSKQDLLVITEVDARIYAGRLAMLSGRGDGRFAASFRRIAGNGSGPLVVTDLDEDGNEDILTTAAGGISCQEGDCTISKGLVVLRGEGEGQFGPVRQFEAVSLPSSMAVADFDADGIKDVSVSSRETWDCDGSDCHPSAGTVGILSGNADGTFGEIRTVLDQVTPSSLAAPDLNDDGFVDLIVSSITMPCPSLPCTLVSDGVKVLMGEPDGFGPVRTMDAGEYPTSMVVADLDGDSHEDLAVAHGWTNPGGLSLLRGLADGNFAPWPSLTSPWGFNPFAIGDMDNDSIPDIVSFLFDSVLVNSGLGDGTFEPGMTIGAGSDGGNMALGDLNKDGALDVVLANGEIAVILTDENGGFMEPRFFGAGGPAGGVALADIDNDGDLDLAVSTCAGRLLASAHRLPRCSGTTSISLLFNRTISPDADGDGLSDDIDNCPPVYNPDQSAGACGQRIIDVHLDTRNDPAVLSWRTAAEWTFTGFNVVRRSRDVEEVLNEAPILCDACTTGESREYSFTIPTGKTRKNLFVEGFCGKGCSALQGPAIPPRPRRQASPNQTRGIGAPRRP